MLVGSVFNLRAITQYRDEYGEIKEIEKRPEMLFILGGLILTIAAIGIAGSLII